MDVYSVVSICTSSRAEWNCKKFLRKVPFVSHGTKNWPEHGRCKTFLHFIQQQLNSSYTKPYTVFRMEAEASVSGNLCCCSCIVFPKLVQKRIQCLLAISYCQQTIMCRPIAVDLLERTVLAVSNDGFHNVTTCFFTM